MARVLVLRQREEADATAQALAARGHVPQILPLQEIVPLDTEVPRGPFGGFVVTSLHAVEALARAFPGDWRPVLAVGTRTAQALREAGFATVVTGEGDGRSLAEAALRLEGDALFLYAAGRVRTPGLEDALAGLGVPCAVWEVYDTRAIEPPAAEVAAVLQEGAPEAVLLLSAGQAEAFARLMGRHPLHFGPMPRLLCLSARIFAALPVELRAHGTISDRPSLVALFDRL